jgi:hypothetical protein
MPSGPALRWTWGVASQARCRAEPRDRCMGFWGRRAARRRLAAAEGRNAAGHGVLPDQRDADASRRTGAWGFANHPDDAAPVVPAAGWAGLTRPAAGRPAPRIGAWGFARHPDDAAPVGPAAGRAGADAARGGAAGAANWCMGSCRGSDVRGRRAGPGWRRRSGAWGSGWW